MFGFFKKSLLKEEKKKFDSKLNSVKKEYTDALLKANKELNIKISELKNAQLKIEEMKARLISSYPRNNDEQVLESLRTIQRLTNENEVLKSKVENSRSVYDEIEHYKTQLEKLYALQDYSPEFDISYEFVYEKEVEYKTKLNDILEQINKKSNTDTRRMFNELSTNLIELNKKSKINSCLIKLEKLYSFFCIHFGKTSVEELYELKKEYIHSLYAYNNFVIAKNEEEKLSKKLLKEEEENKKQLDECHDKTISLEEKIGSYLEKMKSSSDEEKDALQKQISDLKQQLEAVSQIEKELTVAQKFSSGWLYFIHNKSFNNPNIFKIGITRRIDLEKRIDELNSASIPFKYEVIKCWKIKNVLQNEKMIHDTLADYRVNKDNVRKEFFCWEKDRLIETVEDILKKNCAFINE